MKTLTAILYLSAFAMLAQAQQLTQTVRGTLTDADSKHPLIGATVVVSGSDPVIGTSSDVNGNFKLENIEVGRVSLNISYLGYESRNVPNITVNSGKETVLDLTLQESIENLDEVVIKANKKNGEALNEMALVSSRSVSTEQTERFAGSFSDPSRILSNFAGVTSTQDGSNDIIVRGNSPKYVQWRLEGVEITNPNHFEDQNSSSGGINALNNNLLATSDFHTGAFAPEFGDALSGVYDVKLRPGNNEKFESIFGIGLLGTDLTVEGPFKKGYAGSYLLNYRYSTITMIKDIGLVDVDGSFDFQDAAMKVVLPTKNIGSFSVFALGGLNRFKMKDVKRDFWPTPGDRNMHAEITEDLHKNNYLLNSGLTHTLPLSKNGFLKTTLAVSANGIEDQVFESKIVSTTHPDGSVTKDTVGRKLNYSSNIDKAEYRLATKYNHKLNAQNKILLGAKYTLIDYDNHQSILSDDQSERVPLVGFDEQIGSLRNFISWKYRPTQNITLVSGLHNMNVLYNQKSTLEPRLGLNWKLNDMHSVHAGYGMHSTMERVHNYFATVEQEDGSYTEPNKDLDLLKAHHFVLGYKKWCTEYLSCKLEVYYQHLYNLPVENDPESSYATLNEGLEYKYVDLVNKGTGRNYGVELTIERAFDKYYYMANGSLYQSKYTALDGVERNTQYNGNYLVNILAGREFTKLSKKKNKSLAVNGKLFFGGGRRVVPLLRDDNGNLAVNPEAGEYWDYSKAYDKQMEGVHELTINLSYKTQFKRATHELFIDLVNVTNTKGKISEYYDENEPDNVGHMTQFGFFPNVMYKIYF